MVIFPLAPDQTIAQMRSNGARGEGGKYCVSVTTGSTQIQITYKSHDGVVFHLQYTSRHDALVLKSINRWQHWSVWNDISQQAAPHHEHWAVYSNDWFESHKQSADKLVRQTWRPFSDGPVRADRWQYCAFFNGRSVMVDYCTTRSTVGNGSLRQWPWIPPISCGSFQLSVIAVDMSCWVWWRAMQWAYWCFILMYK